MRLSNVAALAALASNALALNVNRFDGKWVRAADSALPQKTRWVTVYNTVTVYAGSKTAAPKPHYEEAVPTPEAAAPEAPAEEDDSCAEEDDSDIEEDDFDVEEDDSCAEEDDSDVEENDSYAEETSSAEVDQQYDETPQPPSKPESPGDDNSGSDDDSYAEENSSAEVDQQYGETPQPPSKPESPGDDDTSSGGSDNDSHAEENSAAEVDQQYGETPQPPSKPESPDDDDTSSGGSDNDSYSELPTKRGFAYNDASLVNTLVRSGTQGSWAYNWDSLSNGLSPDVEFVPMLWSDRADHLSRWPANVEASLAEGSTHILSFNEPDHREQANLAPARAAAAHARHLNPYGSRARIGAPAVTNSNLDGEGTRWLAEFIPACEAEGCQIDFCVAHWYSPHDADDSLIEHLHEVRALCGGDKPVWLTEFAAFGDDGQNAAFLDRTLERLDELPWLERYSYFMVSEGNMISSGTSLSAQGKAFFRVGS